TTLLAEPREGDFNMFQTSLSADGGQTQVGAEINDEAVMQAIRLSRKAVETIELEQEQAMGSSVHSRTEMSAPTQLLLEKMTSTETTQETETST
ncbi:unnamed protein product, partial [Amoebophrya sp. A25]